MRQQLRILGGAHAMAYSSDDDAVGVGNARKIASRRFGASNLLGRVYCAKALMEILEEPAKLAP
jgi:hypothetical protein